jgi:aerobic-type carbon monoxide dehydrogenase small subunit (CoxS/CutS family)
MSALIGIRINDQRFEVPAGISVAAALFRVNQWSFRTSVKGQPRAGLCGMGVCFECRVTVDGIAHTKSCQMAVREGMSIQTS